MAIKELQTRIALKYDTFENWSKTEVADQGANLVLLRGEIGICEVPSVNAASNVAPTVLFKVGDGTKKFSELPWASAKAADVYSWAKASDVVVDGKTIKFVGGVVNSDGSKSDKVITLNFATPEEVEAVRSGLDARLTAIEGSVGTGKVAEDITAIKGRLDVIEGEGDGSIAAGDAATLASAKTYAEGQAADVKSYVDGDFKTAVQTYADGKASAAQSAAEGTAAAALAEYKGQMTAALAGKQDVIAENTYDAYGAAESVKTYVDETVVPAANTYADGKASAAETAAKGYADSIVATEKTAREAKDSELEGKISGNTTAIGNEVTARENAVNAINTKIGTVTEGKNVVTMISDAQAAAEANAATTAQGKVDALANGQVKTNKEAITTLSGTVTSEIARVEGLVTAEAKARDDADKALDERLDAVEAFFATTEGETLDTALDTLKEIQDYLNGEGEATGGMIGRLAQAETDIDNLQKEFDTETGRVKVAEGKIAALEAKDTELNAAIGTKLAASDFNTWKGTHENDHAPSATQIASDITDAVNGEKALREAADTAIEEKIGGSYSKTSTVASAIEAVSTVANRADAKSVDNAGRLSAVEPKVTTLQDIVDGYSAKGSIKTAIEAAQTAADNAQDAADAAQGEVDALEGVVSTLRGEYNVTKALATTNEAAITALDGRVTTAEGNITTLKGIVETGADSNDKLRSAITDLQTLTSDNGAIRSEIADAKKAGTDAAKAVSDLAAGQVATNKTDIGTLNGKVTAIENDYVKASDLVGDFYVFNCGSSTTVTHVVPKN